MRKIRRYGFLIPLLLLLCASGLTGCAAAERLIRSAGDFVGERFSDKDAEQAWEDERGDELEPGEGQPQPEEPIVEKPQDLTGGFSYAYNSLSGDRQRLYDEMLSGIEAMEPAIELSSFGEEDINTAFSALLIDHPELFYIEAGCDLYYERLGERVLRVEFRPRYTMDQEQRSAAQKRIDAYVEACLDSVGQGGSDYDIVKGVYEYLILHTDYDLDAPDNQNICSIFLNGRTVCQGYAKGTQYILNRAGIFCTLVEGYVKEGEHHSWNLVRVEGEYYYMDTTWGDVSYTLSEGGDTGQELPEISYDYLCVNDKMLRETHIIDSILTIPPCNSLEANYYVREGVYFTGVDKEQLRQAFAKAYAEGRKTLTLKCADTLVYREMQDYLVRDGHIFDYMKNAGGAEYLRTDETCILIFYLV